MTASSPLWGLVGLVMLSAACVAPCAAWGCEGHELVAEIAQALLEPAAWNDAATLLALEYGKGAKLSTVACWADEIRDRPEYKWTERLHFVDTPDWACTFDYARDCKDDVCAVGAVSNYTARLAASAGLAPAQRLEALKFLVHFVGDLHQPLHVAFTSDRGGNTVQVEFDTRGVPPLAAAANIAPAVLATKRRRSEGGDVHANLHHVWDDEIMNESLRLLRAQGEANDWQQYGTLLMAKFNLTAAADSGPPFARFCPATAPVAAPAARRALRSAALAAGADRRAANGDTVRGCAGEWAKESVDLACKDAYVDDAGAKLNLQNCTRESACYLSAPYYERAAPVVESQLAKGGVRLADALSRVLGSSRSAVQ